jgi:hypothetical protein
MSNSCNFTLINENDADIIINEIWEKEMEDIMIITKYNTAWQYQPTIEWFQNVIDLIVKYDYEVISHKNCLSGESFLVPQHTHEHMEQIKTMNTMNTLLHQEEILFNDIDTSILEVHDFLNYN